MNKQIFLTIIMGMFLITLVGATLEIQRPDDGGTVNINTFTGNLTNVSEMVDVNVPSPNEGEVLTWNDTSGVWESQTTTATDTSWRANWTAYNITWSAGGVDTWVANFSSYYTSAEVDTLNTSQTNYINANNASVENTIQTDNSSMNNYVIFVNSTMKNYCDFNNDSITNYIAENNETLTNTFVPYTGATGDVDLGANSLDAKHGNFQFDLNLIGNGNQDVVVSTNTPTSYAKLTMRETGEYLMNLIFHGAEYAGTQAGIAKSNLTLLMSEVNDDMGGLMIGTENKNPIYWVTDNVVRMTLNQSGNLELNGTLNATQILINGSVVLTAETTWVANWTAYNTTWSYTYNDTQNDSIVNYITENNASVENTIQTDNSSMNNYVDMNNASINNWIVDLAYATIAYVDTVIAGIGNWTADKGDYYTSAEVDDINTSTTNYINYQNTSINNYITDNNNSVNNNIESKLITIFYDAAILDVITGTPVGTIGNITIYDSLSYNVTEDASDMELRVNFTGITDFNQFILRYKSDVTESHVMIISLWNYDDSVWETYDHIGNTENEYIIRTQFVYDADEHMDGGVVQVRFYTDGGTPPRTHLHQFDWVAITSGPATPSSDETDPFSIHKDGFVSFEANWDQGAFNFTNIASWFLGLISWDRVNGLNTTIDALIEINNGSVENYILENNGSIENYIAENNASIENYILYVNSTNPIENYRLLSNYSFLGGDVGIGTASPDTELHVKGVIHVTDSDRYFVEIMSAGGVGYIDSYDDTGNDYEDLVIRADDFIFVGETTERFRIEDTGNVGIGTDDPQNKLNVVGDANFTSNVTIGGGVIWYNGTHLIFT